MVNEITLSIATKLREVFKEDKYLVYTESVEQGFVEPCFLILLINQTKHQGLGNRYKASFSFALHYFPKNLEQANEECYKVAGTLEELMEYITVNAALIKSDNLNFRIEDKVLVFMLNFTVFVQKKVATLPYMEEILIYDEKK